MYNNAPLSLLGVLANAIREKKNGNKTYFNKNIHIEPTNICVFDCKFCSYSRLLSKKEEAWEYTIDQMVDQLKAYKDKDITITYDSKRSQARTQLVTLTLGLYGTFWYVSRDLLSC